MEKPVVKIKVIEDNGLSLTGYVAGHPNFEDLSKITTSRIICRHPDGLVETANTMYKIFLGSCVTRMKKGMVCA